MGLTVIFVYINAFAEEFASMNSQLENVLIEAEKAVAGKREVIGKS